MVAGIYDILIASHNSYNFTSLFVYKPSYVPYIFKLTEHTYVTGFAKRGSYMCNYKYLEIPT